MPRLPAGGCIPGCNGRAVGGRGRCLKHAVGAGRARQPATRNGRLYRSPAWRAMSRRVIREEPVCRRCRVAPSEVADHIVAVQDGGAPLDRANCQGLCKRCHSSKTQEEINARRATNKSKHGRAQ